jgi:hypothetical protein
MRLIKHSKLNKIDYLINDFLFYFHNCDLVSIFLRVIVVIDQILKVKITTCIDFHKIVLFAIDYKSNKFALLGTSLFIETSQFQEFLFIKQIDITKLLFLYTKHLS